MNEMEIDIEDGLAAGLAGDEVRVPNLVIQRAR